MKKTLLGLCMIPLLIATPLYMNGCTTTSSYTVRLISHTRISGGQTEVLYDCKDSTNPEEREHGKVIAKEEYTIF